MIVDNPNLQELFMFNNSDSNRKQLTIANGKIFAHLNPKLCLYRINNLKTYSTIQNWDDTDVSIHNNGDKEACSKDKLEVELVKSTSSRAIIRFENYALKMNDYRSLLHYLIIFREVANGTVTMFDGRDGCNIQNDKWTTIEEKPTDKKAGHQESDIKLKPATRYALYVKTSTIYADSTGALSDIIYFETAPDTPGIPRGFEGESHEPNSLRVSWLPPSRPNGIVKMYTITITRTPEQLENLQSADICQSTDDRSKITQTITKEEKAISPVMLQNATTSGIASNVNESSPVCPNSCQSAPTSDIDVDIQTEVLTFQDQIIELIYLKQCPNLNNGRNLKRRSTEYESSFMTTTANPTIESRNFPESSKNNATSNEKATSKNGDTIKPLPVINFHPNSNKTEANVTLHEIRSDGIMTYMITGLEHFTSYSIEVSACHGPIVSSEKVKPASSYKRCGIHAITSVRTQPVEDYDRVNSSTIKFNPANETFSYNRVTWDKPINSNGPILAYKVRYKSKDSEFWTETCINSTAYNRDRGKILSNLSPGEYLLGVQVVSMYSLVGRRYWSNEIVFQIQSEYPISPLALTITLILAFILLALAVGSGTYYYQKKSHEFNDGLIYVSANPDYIEYTPDEWEVDKENLIIGDHIGTGAFGMVYKGVLKTENAAIKCAIKTVPPTSTAKQRVDFLREASIMKQFDTFHVVKLMGVISTTTPVYVIMEYMEKGDLKGYLRSQREEHQREKKVLVDGIYLMAAQIADGMAYLASKRFVHRDLAARNCMVGENGIVKIGDFGLTRDIYDNDYYRRDTHGRLPVRWMAPESLRDNLYTTASDVWSYGIVVWEIVTFSASPYQGQSNDEVIKNVMKGTTMSRPDNCPDKLYYIMQKCWKKIDKERPTFNEIVEYLLPMTEDKLYPNCFYRKQKVEGDSIEKFNQDTIDEKNSSGAESFPLLSWPSSCANGESTGPFSAQRQLFS